jgi:hypothetical protein
MKQVSIIGFLILVLFSCRKQDATNFEGPDLNDLHGPFNIIQDLTLNTAEVDFAGNQNVIFYAELSKRTSWMIEITGASSGAKRILAGKDRIINETNAIWTGGADKFPGFGIEKSYIKLSFPEEENAPVFYDSIMVLSEKIDKGVLITSFENFLGANWVRFNQATVTGNIICDGNAPKGICQYGWNGTVGWDWAIGSVMIKAEQGTFNLQPSASNLFFNIAFRALENVGPENSLLLFWFDEDDNGNGVFDPNTEDRYIYQYWSKSTDWDLISLKYADLQFDADGNKVEVKGNGLPEPSKLVAINVFFLANPANGNARALVDHLIFTTNEPYKP